MRISANLSTVDMKLKAYSVDGTIAFRIDDIAEIRGSFDFAFERGEISEDDIPVIIYIIDVMHFLRAILSGVGIHTLYLYFEPRAYAFVQGKKVSLTFLRPDSSGAGDVLEDASIDDVKTILDEVERLAEGMFSRFDAQLRDYLRLLANANAEAGPGRP